MAGHRSVTKSSHGRFKCSTNFLLRLTMFHCFIKIRIFYVRICTVYHCLTFIGKKFSAKVWIKIKSKLFIPSSSEDTTKTQYTTWLTNIKFLFRTWNMFAWNLTLVWKLTRSDPPFALSETKILQTL